MFQATNQVWVVDHCFVPFSPPHGLGVSGVRTASAVERRFDGSTGDDSGRSSTGIRMKNWFLWEINIQCEAPKIAKLVYNSNNYGLWYL